jgi:hypothetical protein
VKTPRASNSVPRGETIGRLSLSRTHAPNGGVLSVCSAATLLNRKGQYRRASQGTGPPRAARECVHREITSFHSPSGQRARKMLARRAP